MSYDHMFICDMHICNMHVCVCILQSQGMVTTDCGRRMLDCRLPTMWYSSTCTGTIVPGIVAYSNLVRLHFARTTSI